MLSMRFPSRLSHCRDFRCSRPARCSPGGGSKDDSSAMSFSPRNRLIAVFFACDHSPNIELISFLKHLFSFALSMFTTF